MPNHHAERPGDLDLWQVPTSGKFHLSRVDPDSAPGAPGDRDATDAASEALRLRLFDLQERLRAEKSRAVLLILQALDGGGKDGAIRRVFSGVIPLGVEVHGFGPPSEEESAHDFLWRAHARVPEKGKMGIFNRSHYEDVLVVRVKKFVPESVWKGRYDIINGFEAGLVAAGTSPVKVMLHLSKDEQRERLQARIDDPTKRWKFRMGDLDDRKLWNQYMEAYEDALDRTSTVGAPWYCVPGNKKWYRDWAVLSILVATMEKMDPKYPDHPELDGVVVT